MKNARNRQATPKIRQEKTQPVPVEIVTVSDPPFVAKCPHCGRFRMHQWDTYSGGRDGSEPYKQCMGCGNKYKFLKDGTMTLVG